MVGESNPGPGQSDAGRQPNPPPPPPRSDHALVFKGARDREAWINPDDLVWSFSRSSGPGGQNVNKVNTRAELRVRPGAVYGLDEAARARLASLAGKRLTKDGEMVFAADTHRSQLDNRNACLDRLRAVVVMALSPPRKRRPTKPSRAAKERRLDAKKREGVKKANRRWSGE